MAKAKRLTALQVENAKPDAVRVETPDAGCRGLYLVIQPSGSKGFAVRYRFAGKPRKLTLGPEPGAPRLSLAAARKLTADALHKVENGIDPAKQKRDATAASHDAAATRAADTVEHLAAAFVDKYARPHTRTWKVTEAIFRREVLKAWKGRSVHDIDREHVENLIDRIADDRPIMANRVHSIVRKWFSWMIGKGRSSLHTRLKINPALGIERPGKVNRRDRVLSADEIVALWKAAEAVGHPFGSIIQMLILTGQRRGEVARMARSELDLDRRLWSMSGDRTKNGLPHIVPLSSQALQLIRSAPEIAGGFVFTVSGAKPVGDGFARIKKRVDALMKPGTPFVLHDIRRSVATHMAERLRIPPHIVEAVLNHVSGHKAGVAGVYNRAIYAEEKAEALARWGAHVGQLVTGKPAKVVHLRKSARLP
jgi:integrase